VLIGERNAIAPPLAMAHGDDGSVWTEFELGAAYEGPPGHVHGGVCALILDHVLGAAVHQPGRPAVTGTLTTRYRHGTPLSRTLRAEARIARVDGVKTFVSGQITAGGVTTVEADGIFFFPR
jgi:acyl-coenzyme A thioesterase PaaI-like protein